MNKLRTLIVGSTVAALITLMPAGFAQASGWYGQDAYTTGCSYTAYNINPPPNRTWNQRLVVRDRSGVVAGYVLIQHSRSCGTAWVTYGANPGFGGEVSIWNSWNQNRKAWVSPGSGARTTMVDDVSGVTTCVGTQVYLNNGYRNWDMGFCW